MYNKLQTRSLVREDALNAEQRNCHTKEEQDKIWSRVPKGVPIPRPTGRLTVGRKTNSNSNSPSSERYLRQLVLRSATSDLLFVTVPLFQF
jgi:hypothetical protein